MVDFPSLKIAGRIVLGGNYGTHFWPRTLGPKAPEVVWALDVETAAYVLAQREVEIVFTPPRNQKQVTIKRVVVVCERPSDDPLIRYVCLSDQRWYLPKIHVRRAYNIQTNSGTAHLTNVEGIPFQNQQLGADVIYAGATLKGSDDGVGKARPWTSLEIVDDVAAALGIKFKKMTRPLPAFAPSELYVDSRGDVALAQVLGAVGGVDIRVEDDGSFTLVDSYLGAEKSTIEDLIKSSLEWKGRFVWIDMSHVAPVGFDVLYERQVEVRSDAWEISPGTFTNINLNNQPTCENVIQQTRLVLYPNQNFSGLPGPSMSAPGSGTPTVVGTWLAADVWFATEGSTDLPSPLPPGVGALTRKFLCAGVPGLQGKAGQGGGSPYLDNTILQQFVTPAGKENLPDPLWQASIDSMLRCFRRVYRLNPVFSRQCVPGSIVAERVALIDAANGLRQKSPVYIDYTKFPTYRGVEKSANLSANMHSIPGSPTSQDVGDIKVYADPKFPTVPFRLEDAKPGPFTLHVIDPITGIFEIKDREDAYGKVALQIPSLLTNVNKVDPSNAVAEARVLYYYECALVQTQRVAFIFSATPLGPNNEAQLHKYPVDAFRALTRLGISGAAVSPKGPRMQLKIGAGVTRARFAWDDDQRSALLGCFDGSAQSSPKPLFPVNNAECLDYAESCAASYLSTLLDHYEGSAVIGWTPELKPVGSLNTVGLMVDDGGSFYTTANATGVFPGMQVEGLLSQSSRATLLRSIAP